MTYRPDIDGLRAVAVLGVALNHVGLGFPGGYVGVDVFFVISGYLIAGLMLKDLRAGTFSLAHFWERRLRRILPALFVVVAVSFVAGWFLLLPNSYQMFGRSVVSLVSLRSNDFFARHTDYFADSIEEMPLLHTWSLAVEEQFYLFVPLLFWAATRLRCQAWLGPLIGLFAVVSFAYGVWATTMCSQWAYYLLSTRAWELLAGVLAAIFLKDTLGVPAAARELVAIAGLSSIAVPFFVYDATTPFPGFAALPPVVGAVLLIASGGRAECATVVHRLLASRAAVGVGLISYSMYLWHWPLVVFAKHHSGLLSASWGRGLVLLGAAVLAYITYRYVEQPFRRRDLLATRPKLIAATAAAAAALLIGGQALRFSEGVIDRLPQQAQLFVRTSAMSSQFICAHRAEDVPHHLLRVGAADVAPKLFVWGDSHAMTVLPAIDAMCRSAGIAAECAVHSSRPPVVRYCLQASPQEIVEASAYAAAVLRHVKSSDFDAVLLAGFWSDYFVYPRFADSILETIDELRAAGRRVYFLQDVPKYDFDVAAALISRAWHGGDIQSLAFPRQAYDLQNRHHETFLPKLVERGVQILDPIPYLRGDSSAGNILPFDTGGSFYRDSNHLSVYGAQAIQPVFALLINEVAKARPPVGPVAETVRSLNANDSRRAKLLR